MQIKFIQDIIDILRDKKGSRSVYKKNNIQINEKIKKNINLNICGENNSIIIKSESINGKIDINIYGDNNFIFIDNNVYLSVSISIFMGQNHPYFGKIYNSSFEILKDTSIEQMSYVTYNSNTYCKIGEDCMLSYGITIYNTDAHPIFDKDTKQLINRAKGIEIGKHSWICQGVTILKNSTIPNNSIVGCNAVFSGRKDDPYCAYAGNPAKVVKSNVIWDRNGKDCGYIDNEQERIQQ